MPPQFPTTKKTVRLLLDDVHYIKLNLKRAFDRANADRQDGFPDRNGEPVGGSTSDISDPTSSLALGSRDDIEWTQKELVGHLNSAKKHIAMAKRKVINLAGLEQEEAKRIADDIARKSRECIHCQAIVLKVVKGRCDTCYRYFEDHNYDRPLPQEKTQMGARYGTIKPQSWDVV